MNDSKRNTELGVLPWKLISPLFLFHSFPPSLILFLSLSLSLSLLKWILPPSIHPFSLYLLRCLCLHLSLSLSLSHSLDFLSLFHSLYFLSLSYLLSPTISLFLCLCSLCLTFFILSISFVIIVSNSLSLNLQTTKRLAEFRSTLNVSSSCYHAKSTNRWEGYRA